MAWSKDETAKLIDIWARTEVQAQVEGCHRNRDVYEKMAQALRTHALTTNVDALFQRAGKFENGVQSESRWHILDGTAR